MTFESLPVELIAEILGELDLKSLIKMSYLSKRLHDIASDSSLNPWRRPILRTLRSSAYEEPLKNLSVRLTVPRQNWIEILSLARPSFILFEATLPNIKAEEWEECFNRRFLPSWRKWKKDGTWKEVYLKILHRVWHRSVTSCTSDESWMKYIVLNRNGSANNLEVSSRNFNPLAIFNEMKLQSNLAHLETRIRLVLELADIRILALGTVNRPRNNLTLNTNAHIFLHPPGVNADDIGPTPVRRVIRRPSDLVEDHGVYPVRETVTHPYSFHTSPISYTRLVYPLPAPLHANYPFYTPGGGDKRWLRSGEVEEEGLQWVGGLMIIAQILGPRNHEISGDWPPLQDLDLVIGSGRQQYTPFTWSDLWAIAPWLKERITKRIEGPGLGL